MKTAALCLFAWIPCAACHAVVAQEDVPEGAPAAAQRSEGDLADVRWTQAFLTPANLVADEIVIEGPPALRQHFLVRQESQTSEYSAQTTPQGFLQQLVSKPESGYVELFARLDGWQIVAFRRITWLERPGLGPVTIRASGQASWQAVDGAASERRGELLEFRGDIQR